MEWFETFLIAGLFAWALTFPLGLYWSLRAKRKAIPKPFYHRLHLRLLSTAAGGVAGALVGATNPMGLIVGLAGGALATLVVKQMKEIIRSRTGVSTSDINR